MSELFRGALTGQVKKRGPWGLPRPRRKKTILNKNLSDHDRDGVGNVIDCAPYNRNKQGVIHKVARKIVKKIPAKGEISGYVKKKALRRIEQSEKLAELREKATYERRRAVQAAYLEERKARAVRRAKIKARVMPISIGEGARQVGLGLSSVQSYLAQPTIKPIAKQKRKRKRKRKKKR
jgi:uncharacterized protein (DUF2384 family)